MTGLNEPDSVLVGRAVHGDVEAAGRLVKRYLQPAYAVALARVANPTDAEDVCQDAFLTAVQRIEDCRNPEKFGAWLLRIVRNRAIDYCRDRKTQNTLPIEHIMAATDRADPEREMEQAELREELLAAMMVLTDLQREVLLLYDFEGWSHREIAEKIGISEGSARVHLCNGRRALRERLVERYGIRS